MSDYKERFERWTKKATDKLEEIDSQYGLKEKIEGGAKTVFDAAKTGAEYIKTEAEKSDIGKSAVRVTEDVVTAATDTAKTAWNASEPVRDVAVDAGGGIAAGQVGHQHLMAAVDEFGFDRTPAPRAMAGPVDENECAHFSLRRSCDDPTRDGPHCVVCTMI